MIAALRYARFALLADIVVMLVSAMGFFGASLLGFGIQSLKWITVFYGGVLMILAALLSVVAITLQIIVAFRRQSQVS